MTGREIADEAAINLFRVLWRGAFADGSWE